MKYCEVCHGDIFKPPHYSYKQWKRTRFCSKKCLISWLKVTNTGRKHTEEHKRKISESGKGRIHSPEALRKMSLSRIGIKFSEETRRKMSESMKGRPCSKKVMELNKARVNEKHPNWKGDNVGYRSLHIWVTSRLGKARICDVCGLDRIPTGKKRYFQWANLSHEYKRDLSDWKQMCIKCHTSYDRVKN